MRISNETNQETKDTKKWKVMKTVLEVVAEVEKKGVKLKPVSYIWSHWCCLPNVIVMFRTFTSRLLLVIDYCRL